MNNDCCYLSEIYSAIQGEGPLVGVRQIFLRFSACDLRCIWCDTPESLVRTETCQVEKTKGTRNFETINNPVESSKLVYFISRLLPNMHHSISLTGGEPLLQSDFLFSFLPILKKEFSVPIYLESGGHRPDELLQIVDSLDYISMDFKLPSSAKTIALWEKHKEFLNIALSSKSLKDVWVKIVITKGTLFDELLMSLNLVKSLNKKNKNVEIFLQPVTKINGLVPPDEIELLNIQSKLLEHYSFIRVLPQVHKLIGQK